MKRLLVIAVLASGCAPHLPTQPDIVTPEIQTTPASIRLTLSSRPDRTYDVTATVLTADGHFVKDVPLAFKMDSGTVTPEAATTNGNGLAQAIVSTSSSATLTVSSGSLTASTRVDAMPGPVVITPTPPPPPTPLPSPAISLQPITTTVGVSTLFITDAFVNGGQAVTSTSWTFGDGGTAVNQGNGANHVYTVVGSFTAKVTATDALGRKASASAPVTVNAVPPPPPPPTPTPAALNAFLNCTPAAHLTSTVCNVSAMYGGVIVPASTITETRWDWGDGTTVDQQTTPPTIPLGAHSYVRVGTYTLYMEIRATTADGPKFAAASKVLVIP